jgi:hypothetical protein
VNVYEELTKIARVKGTPKATKEAFNDFARRLTDKVGKACDASEETWAGLSEPAKAWFNAASKALHEKTAVPELPGMGVAEEVKEASTEAPAAAAAEAAQAEPGGEPKATKATKADNGGRQGRLPSETGGLEALREKWNELVKVVEAEGLGIARAKWHKVTFESYAMSHRRIAWLEQEIAARRAAKEQPQPASHPAAA